MSIERLTGTPWHLERVHREEGDERRYKGRCKYYQYNKNYCKYKFRRCTGSAHCDEYEAISEEEFRKRQKEQQAAKRGTFHSDDDIYWY